MRNLVFLDAAKTALSLAVLGAGALVAGTAGATTLPTFNAPGIPKPGFPDFINNGNVSLVFGQIGGRTTNVGGYSAPTGDYVLAAASSSIGTKTPANFTFNTTTSSYNVQNEIFATYAVFNSKGQFLSGGETIYGALPTYGKSPGVSYQNLYTVSFDKFAISTSSVGLGFQTNFKTATGWAKQFQTVDESMYLYGAALASLDNALATGKGLPSLFTATVSEITTVPLPGVAWLFGPAFAALVGLRRRNRSGNAGLDVASA